MNDEILLGTILTAKNSIVQVKELLAPEHFEVDQCRDVYRACLQLDDSGKKCNLASVAKTLQTFGWEPAETYRYVQFLASKAVNPDELEILADDIVTRKARRQAKDAADCFLQAIARNEPLEDSCSSLELSLSDILSCKKSQARTVDEILKDFALGKNYLEYMDERVAMASQGLPVFGISTGYNVLDSVIGGWGPGMYVALGARTSMGKTSLAVNFALNAIQENVPVGFVSLEMDHTAITQKFVSALSQVHVKDLLKGTVSVEEMLRVREVIKWMKEYPLFLYAGKPLDVPRLKSTVRSLSKQDGCKVIFVDYLTLIRGGKHPSKHLEVSYVSKALQWMAKEFEVCIVALAQLNREVTSRSNHKPQLNDFRESGSIEEDIDVALMPHRPRYYDESIEDDVTQLIIAKNRLFGELTHVDFDFEVSSGRYTERKLISTCLENIRNQAAEEKEWDEMLFT